jgi:hypothetical protein
MISITPWLFTSKKNKTRAYYFEKEMVIPINFCPVYVIHILQTITYLFG